MTATLKTSRPRRRTSKKQTAEKYYSEGKALGVRWATCWADVTELLLR